MAIHFNDKMSCTSRGPTEEIRRYPLIRIIINYSNSHCFHKFKLLEQQAFCKPTSFFSIRLNSKTPRHNLPEFLFQRFGGQIFANSPGSWTIRAAGQWCVLLLCRYRLCLVASLDCFSTSVGLPKSEEFLCLWCVL